MTRILVVDNQSIIAKGIETCLVSAGYQVIGLALSGEEAVQMAIELHPDLALMDIVMEGGIDGIEAAARIRACLDIPIIYITAFEDKEFLRRACQTEPFGYLIKPVESAALHSAIEMALYKHCMEKRLKQHIERQAIIRAIDQSILSNHSILSTLNEALQHVRNGLQVDAVEILLLNPFSQLLETVALCGFEVRNGQPRRTNLAEPLTGETARTCQPFYLLDASQLPSTPRPTWMVAEGFQAYLGLPLIQEDRLRGVLEIYHRASLAPDAEWLNFLEALRDQVLVALNNASLFEDLQSANVELSHAYHATISGWSRALELRDGETEGHSQRVTEMTLRIGRRLGIPEIELAHIQRGALLHDIGKMGIPDSILLKPGPLTSAEWEIMRQHPQHAYDLLSGISFLQPALHIPYCHHEKWDGSGYPHGLKGEQIPLAARIFAIADVWDALRSDRPYHRAWSDAQALQYIYQQSGNHFDPQIVEIFFSILNTFDE